MVFDFFVDKYKLFKEIYIRKDIISPYFGARYVFLNRYESIKFQKNPQRCEMCSSNCPIIIVYDEMIGEAK